MYIELARSHRGYFTGIAVWCMVGILYPAHLPLRANPSGGTVTGGSASISTTPGQVTVNQSSQRAVVNWQGFSIDNGEKTTFVQPNGSAETLNRVTGGAASHLNGTLNATGKVYLVNPQGVVVGKSGRVNTGGGFTASTLDVSDAQFLNGKDMNFSGSSSAKVVNYGKIRATGGDVTLIARQVENHGKITAKNGRAQLAAGTEVLIKSEGAERVYIRAGAKGAPEGTGVLNTGRIKAAVAELKAAGGNEYALAIQNTGLIRATGARTEGGRVYLTASGGKVVNGTSGRIRAVNRDGSGGEVRVAGGKIELKRGSSIDASGIQGKPGAGGRGGTILVGGEAQGKGTMEQAQGVTVEAGAELKADASAAPGSPSASADGGTVVVWSTGLTQFDGSISAQGIGSGKGGWVETSGHELGAGASARVLTGGGQWLLDPLNLYIVASGGLSPSVAAANAVNSLTSTSIDAETIRIALNGSNVSLQAGAIFVNAPIDASGNALGGNLFLDSPFSLSLAAPITLRAGSTLSGNAIRITVYPGGKIQNGVDAAADSTASIVNVTPGTYYENVRIINKSVTVRGADQLTTIVNGNGNLSTEGGSVATGTGDGPVFAINASNKTVILEDLTMTNGVGTSVPGFVFASAGGGVQIQGGNVHIVNSTLRDNKGDGGAGLASFSDGAEQITITGCTFRNNTSTNLGGGAYMNAKDTSSVVITNSTFDSNTADSAAGGIELVSNDAGANFLVTGSTFSNNRTSNSPGANGGGMLAVGQGKFTISNSTFTKNSSYYVGGLIISAQGSFAATVESCTIVGNTAVTTCGGVLCSGSNQINVINSIICLNTSGNTATAAGSFTFTNSLIDNPNPGLAPLGDYGGPTQTMALLVGSPALTGGSTTLTTDQRGQTRTGAPGSQNIGAYSASGILPLFDYVVRNTQDYNIATTAPIANSLRVALSFAEAPSLVTFAIPGAGMHTITVAAGANEFEMFRTATIDGTSQPGYSGTPLITIAGNGNRRVLFIGPGSGKSASIKGVRITGGRSGSTASGGGAYVSSGIVEFDRVIIDDNLVSSANAYGGGIFVNVGANVTVTNSTIADNAAVLAGGIYVQGTLTLRNSVLSGNAASNYGGAIRNNAGTVTIENSTFVGNTAQNEGGAIATDSGTLTITASTFESNRSIAGATNSRGGAIYNVNTTVTLNNSTLADNTAREGGAIYNLTGPLNLRNTTIATNGATATGGGLYISGGTVTLINSIIAQNSATTGTDIYGTVDASSSYNIVGDTSSSAGFNPALGNLLNIDPLLAPLGNYGGMTRTFALLPGSPAMEAGTALFATDQRDIARAQGALPDIGAFESRGFNYVLGNNFQSTPLGSAFAPLSVTVTAIDPGLTNLAGGRVVLSVPVSGATATGILTQTLNSSGQAFFNLTAAGDLGTYQVHVISAAPAAVFFTLTNTTIPVTILPNGGQGKVYGDADPVVFGYTIGGGPSITLNGLLLRMAGENAGTYGFDISSLIALNPLYTVTLSGSASGFTIRPATLTVTATDAFGTAGEPFPTLGGTVTGFRFNDSLALVNGLTYNTLATFDSPAGIYLIIPSGAFAANYTFIYRLGNFTLGAAPEEPRPETPAREIFSLDTAAFNATLGRNNENDSYYLHSSPFFSHRYTITYSGKSPSPSGTLFHISSQDVVQAPGAGGNEPGR